MKRRYILFLSILFSALAAAQTLKGTVHNGTSNKPSAGDEVILIKLGQGMEEAAHTKSDSTGAYTLKIDDPGPHLVRVVHQGVTYHHMVPPGTTTADVDVFDVAKKIDSINVTADVMRFQATGNELEGIRLFAVNNTSDPPRTQMNEVNFEFYLPPGAEVGQSMAMTANGQPVNSPPVPQKEKNLYAFSFPLRPGETQFQVVYHMAYSGKMQIDPKLRYGAQHFVVMLPKSMTFTPANNSAFKPMDDPRQSDATVRVVTNAASNQALGFTISGTGTLQDADENAGNPRPEPNSATASPEDKPGGGLGPPIEAPDPLEKYRWFILGGFGVAMTAGAIVIAGRSKSASVRTDDADEEYSERAPVARAAATGRPGLLLEALKEELFQLEIDRKQGKLSAGEYESAKSALDQTLERALKRGS